jgi:hypothetical protein
MAAGPRPDALPNIYTTLGSDYDDRVLPSITNEVRLRKEWGRRRGLWSRLDFFVDVTYSKPWRRRHTKKLRN